MITDFGQNLYSMQISEIFNVNEQDGNPITF